MGSGLGLILDTLSDGYNNDARGNEIAKPWTRRIQGVGFVFIRSHQGDDEKHFGWLLPRIPAEKVSSINSALLP